MRMITMATQYLTRLEWSVIPVSEKVPLIKWKEYQERLPDIREIENWWTQWPDANIGLVTGKISGIVVFDCDSQAGIDYMKEQGLPNTATVQSSKSYKRHFYFRYPENADIPSFNGRQTKWNVDIDVKAEGGYTVLPPSKHKSGKHYFWVTRPSEGIAHMDQWQFQFIFYRKKKLKKKFADIKFDPDFIQDIQYGVDDGVRDDTAFRLACFYRNKGYEKDKTAREMYYWNLKNRPPLKKNEIDKCIASAYSYQKQGGNWLNVRK